MQEYNFHIHGKPYSQDVWKNDEYRDYLSSMYSNAYINASSDESYMIIEIYNKTVHYTYMRSKGIRDNAEREGSFFAITVSFKGRCCSVAALYNLLDQIYNKIAKPSFFVNSEIAGCLKYKVLQLEDANSAVQMQLAFDKNVIHLNIKDLSNLPDTIRSNETKIVSLKDVDSPAFEEMLLRNRIVVSPILDSAIKRCSTIESELTKINIQKQYLLSSNEQLQSDIATLTSENNSLSNQINASTSSIEKKYKSKLEQLQNDLASITNERDTLKQKILEATSTIELIDQPFQKLTRLLAGRFSENRSQRSNDHWEEKQEIDTKSKNPVWRDWLNSILLGIILVCCCFILFFVLKGQNGVDDQQNFKVNTTEITNNSDEGYNVLSSLSTEEYDVEEDASYESKVEYDDWSKCFPNIADGGKQLKLNKLYKLYVAINGTNDMAFVPDGLWNVFIDQGQMLNNDDSFILTDASAIGKKVTIQYVVNNNIVLSRVCEIIQ